MGEQFPHMAMGVAGKWVQLGTVGVDGAAIGISDPAFVGPNELAMYQAPKGSTATRWGSGIQFWSGFGDGTFEVWGWEADFGVPGAPDRRIAQVVITMITPEDAEEWKESFYG